MTLLYAKKNILKDRPDWRKKLVDVFYHSELQQELRRKGTIIFLTNTVLSHFIKKDDAAALMSNLKLQLMIDEAQGISRLFLNEIFDVFCTKGKNGAQLPSGSGISLFLDTNQVLDPTVGNTNPDVIPEYFSPPITPTEIRSIFDVRQPGYTETSLTENLRNSEDVHKLLERYLKRVRDLNFPVTSLPIVSHSSDPPALLVRDNLKTASVNNPYTELVKSVAEQCKTDPERSFGVFFLEAGLSSDPNRKSLQQFATDLDKAMVETGAPARSTVYQTSRGKSLREDENFDVSNVVWVMNSWAIRGVEFSNVIIPYIEPNSGEFERLMYIAQSRTRGNLWCHATKEIVEIYSSNDPLAPQAKIYVDLYTRRDL
jgi:hypothetical protein